MDKKIFLVVIVASILIGNTAFSQQKVLPGNVKELYFWGKVRASNDGYYWENLMQTKADIPINKLKGDAFNFNPSVQFNSSQDSLIVPLGTTSKRKQTVFIVYKVKDSLKEQLLWTINDTKKTIGVATNKRLADLKRYSYQSYNEKVKPQKANIHFFQQNITDSVAKPSVLIIGLQSKFDKLPVAELDGNISEILIYNSVLSGFETQKIGSYLAIKYGISLSQFDIKNYLNSQGKTIWDNDKHKGFQANITGVGRDDASGLLQLKSSNMVGEGLLTMELKSKNNAIPDNYFAFWSDNGKSLLVKKQTQGEPIGLDRTWQLNYTSIDEVFLDWAFDPKHIKGQFPENTYFWLLIDHSGKETFDKENSEYVKLGSTSSKEKLLLNNFNWDKQKGGSTKFTLKIAPQMFSRVWITQADCGVANSGQMNYSIEGGQAPFTITVKKQSTDGIIKQWIQDAKSSTCVHLSSGNYDYIVKDAKGNLYTETVFVADKQGIFPKLNSNYQLTNGNSITLDASAGLAAGNYQYEWYYEGNFIDNNPKILIDQAGKYELRLVSDQQCKTVTSITVTSDGIENGTQNVMILYPNPTVDGHFTIAMQFAKKTNATISVYAPNGSLIHQKKFLQIEKYIYDDTIKSSSGMYLVTVQSDYGTKAFKVLVR
jgi:hypothetical protein